MSSGLRKSPFSCTRPEVGGDRLRESRGGPGRCIISRGCVSLQQVCIPPDLHLLERMFSHYT